MKPSLCRMVVVLGIDSSGTAGCPAVITRVWSEGDTIDGPVSVNLTIFPDNAPPDWRSSVPLYDTRELAEASAEKAVVAFWPGRVGSTEPHRNPPKGP